MEHADIVLTRDRTLESQMQAVLALAGPEHAHDVHWRPRPGVPHGGVIETPAHVAEAHRLASAPHVAEPEEEPDDAELDLDDAEEGDEEESGTKNESGEAGREEPDGTGEPTAEQAKKTTKRRRRPPVTEGSAE